MAERPPLESFFEKRPPLESFFSGAKATDEPDSGGGFFDEAKNFFKAIPGGALKGLSSALSAGGEAASAEMAQPMDIPSPAETQQALEKNVTGTPPQPQGTGGKYGETVGEFLGNPASYVGPGGLPLKIGAAITGGIGSEALGQLTEGDVSEPYARILGGMIGGAAPNITRRVVTPLPANARHLGHVQTLEGEGVTGLTAGERTGYRPLRYMEEHLGGSPLAGRAAEERLALPREQITRAALLRVGENADRATPEVVDRAHARIGNNFDMLAARNNAPYDPQYMQELFNAQHQYDFLFVDPLRKPIVENVIEHATNKIVRSRVMTGEEYQSIRSRIERVRRSQRNDPEMSEFLAAVRDATDNLMERAIARNNPADLGAWREVRNQYRNMLIIDRATTGVETGGLLTPAKLKQGAVGQNRRAYARGQGDFADLARAGDNVLPGLPQSGTAPRRLTEAGPLKLLTTGITGRALMSGPVQRYLRNQRATGFPVPPLSTSMLRGGAVGAMTSTPRDEVESKAKQTLQDARTNRESSYTKEQMEQIRQVARGNAPVDTVMRVKRLLERPGYGGPQ